MAPDSPALALGFVNFPMDLFGVRHPRLKATARRAVFPDVVDIEAEARALAATRTADRDNETYAWTGAKVKNVNGMTEESIAGTPGETGVLELEVPPGSATASICLEPHDVILGLENRKVDSVKDLLEYTKAKDVWVTMTLTQLQKQKRQLAPF